MATHSSILAWKIPWTEEPGTLQSMGVQKVGHNCATEHKQRGGLGFFCWWWFLVLFSMFLEKHGRRMGREESMSGFPISSSTLIGAIKRRSQRSTS